MRKFFRLQAVVPFETAFAAFCIYSGIAGIVKFGIIASIFTEVLGSRLAFCFNVLYILSGLALFLGIGLNKRNTEALGLIIISGSLLIRSIVIWRYVGPHGDVVGSYIYAVMFIVAAAVRFYWLGHSVVMVQADKQIDNLTGLRELR